MPPSRRAFGLILVLLGSVAAGADGLPPREPVNNGSAAEAPIFFPSASPNRGAVYAPLPQNQPHRADRLDALDENRGSTRDDDVRQASAVQAADAPSRVRPEEATRTPGLAPPRAQTGPQPSSTPPRQSIPFTPGQRADRTQAPSPSERPSPLRTLVTVGSSLAVVLGLFFVLAWFMRRTAPRGSTVLPQEVFELLGRAPLATRQQVHLLRLGNKLVLISATPAGVEAISEVIDPAEVERLSLLCRQTQPHSATATFRQMVEQFSGDHPRQGLPAPRKAREDDDA